MTFGNVKCPSIRLVMSQRVKEVILSRSAPTSSRNHNGTVCFVLSPMVLPQNLHVSADVQFMLSTPGV